MNNSTQYQMNAVNPSFQPLVMCSIQLIHNYVDLFIENYRTHTSSTIKESLLNIQNSIPTDPVTFNAVINARFSHVERFLRKGMVSLYVSIEDADNLINRIKSILGSIYFVDHPYCTNTYSMGKLLKCVIDCQEAINEFEQRVHPGFMDMMGKQEMDEKYKNIGPVGSMYSDMTNPVKPNKPH